MAELLLEILSEEIPARMQARAAEDLKRLVCDQLNKDGFEFESAKAYATPRRLALVVDGLPLEIKALEEERRGPPKTAPEKAVEGFAKSTGISVDQLEIRDTGKGEYYFAVIKKDARLTIDYMRLVASGAVINFVWPKSMRWHSGTTTWVRPIQSILAVFDGKPLKDFLQLGLEDKVPGLKIAMNNGSEAKPGELEIPISNTTRAHRFLTDTVIEVNDFADYKKQLEDGYVILDAAERRARIKEGAEKLAADAGLHLRDDPALLDEVAGLVEWPVPLIGSIDAEFMVLWSDVLVTAMRKHQKYFALEDKDGNLAPKFIVVANKDTPDAGAAIIAGNERVLRARLADAMFFRDQDMAQPLESYVPYLKNVVFHRELGSIGDKVQRMEILAGDIAAHNSVVDLKPVRRAAHLSKADLVTQMVGEFPELQGTMGRRYAYYGSSGEVSEVASAIEEHYAPQGPSDVCPTAPVSVAVALADKIDTLVGFWVINEKPTGSKDPFGLRRAALGVIRLVIENELRVNLKTFFESADELIQSSLIAAAMEKGGEQLEEEESDFDPDDLLSFFAERLKVHLREKGVRHDLVSAVFAVGGEDDLVRLLARVDALSKFLETEDGANLLTVYKRAANILGAEEKRDSKKYVYDGATPLVSNETAEQALIDTLMDVGPNITSAIDSEKFSDALELLASTRTVIDDFFDQVTVNVEESELREARLTMLDFIRKSFEKIADFSQIEGGER